MITWITERMSKNPFRRVRRVETQGTHIRPEHLEEQCNADADGFSVFSEESWKAVAASEIGAAHVLAEIPCQDVSRQSTDFDTLIACVADGAGSARYSDKGARKAADQFVTVSRDMLNRGDGQSLTDIVSQAFEEARLAVLKIDDDPREYATTLLGLVAKGDALAAIQVGDGAIIVDGEVVVDSHAGEYSNETRFITEPDAKPATFSVSKKMTRVAMLTDGLENIALENNGYLKVPHTRFFDPMYEWLEGSNETDRAAQLGEFLVSDRVRSRTTDDVTLLLAMR